MSDSLYTSVRGEGMKNRFYDLMNQPTDNRDAEEIINDVIK